MTRTRGRKLHPSELDKEQRALYDEILGGPRAGRPGAGSLVDDTGRLEGPFNNFLLQPAVGHALQAVGVALRYGTDLADRWREITILVVAAHHGAEFEQRVHEPIARDLGLTDQQIGAIRAGDLSALEPDDALIAGAVQQMLTRGDVDDLTYDALRTRLGEAQVFELTSVVGYYGLLALQLRVFAVTGNH